MFLTTACKPRWGRLNFPIFGPREHGKLDQRRIDLGYEGLQHTHRHFLDLVHRGAHSHVVAQLCDSGTLIFNSDCLSQAQNLPVYRTSDKAYHIGPHTHTYIHN